MKVDLRIEAVHAAGKPKVWAYLEFKNEGRQDALVEKYRIGMSPENSEPSNKFFKVRAGENAVPYTGMMKKRSPPGPGDYLAIKPGEVVKTSFDLSKAYAWSNAKTEYTIWYEVVAKSPPVEFTF